MTALNCAKGITDIMQGWKSSRRVFLLSSLQIYRKSFTGLNELYFSSTFFAQHNWSRAFLHPRDAELTSNGWRSPEKFKTSQQQNYATIRDHIYKPAKTQKRPRTLSSQKVRKQSSELHQLRFEDLRESEIRRVQKDFGPNEKEGLEILFGVTPCLLALSQGRRTAHCLFVKNGEGVEREAIRRVCQEAVKQSVPIQRVSKQTLDKMCGGKVHQGLCLEASSLGFITETRVMASRERKATKSLWLVLDRVQDPMNLGAILRSAYFLGVDRIASSIQNSCPLTPTVSKASAGVMEIMEVFGYSNLHGMIKEKMEQGWQVVGTVGFEEGDSQKLVVPCSTFRMARPTLLLMGGESEGLSPELHELCDVLLTIPPYRVLHPGVESLNVSVATGILLHSLLSTRTGSSPERCWK